MRKRVSLSVSLILAVIAIVMGVTICKISKDAGVNTKGVYTDDQLYECMENPIDPLFAQALSDSRSMMQSRQIQQYYFDIWKIQYEEMMKKIRKKCKYAEDIANFEAFIEETEKGFHKLQPLILNEMLDNYNMPESPEKNSLGNGTQERLLMYQGTMYRNACMFFIPFMDKNEYTFPVREVRRTLLDITTES